MGAAAPGSEEGMGALAHGGRARHRR
jgi:hypothetical protein